MGVIYRHRALVRVSHMAYYQGHMLPGDGQNAAEER